ncbi:MAG: SDR family oxidoreductase [Gemmatimonadetes bacterium]|nr:SDR family oxidoreductase [Gemmatimonadota bacterium]
MDLAGRVAFVTGGSGDVGAAVSQSLATAGVDVALSYVGNADGAAKTVDAIQALGRRALAVQVDQRDPAAIDAATRQVVERFGRVDMLVNNAAWNIGIPFKNLDALTSDVWDRVLETNLRGPFLLARALAPHLREHGCGRIVNIASIGGLYPTSSSIAYSASKAGLIHLTRCLAVALAPEVTVNCVAPGLIEGTRMAQRLPDEVANGVRDKVVLGRTASIADIAEQVVTFCRSESITGQVLVIDGGEPGCMR